MYIILVSYRARGVQTFRREQLINAINNFKIYFEQNKIEYNIIICEQNNDNRFNRGLLLNAAFLESEKKIHSSKIYIHMNVDYNFDLSKKFPQELLDFKKGFLELFKPNAPVLGSACIFDAESYKTINGFPNDIEGWGGDDWAILNRIIENNIDLNLPNELCNSGFIIETIDNFVNEQSNNINNITLAKRNDFKYNGLNSLKYKIDGNGEFNDGNIIFHYLINNE